MESINGIESFDDTLIKELPLNTEKLSIWYSQISSFKGCENLPINLKKLVIGYNQISSFKGCENLPKNLKKLDIGYNQISSFKGCENLPINLKELYLYGNKISSFEHSENLPKPLKELHLYGNQFEHSENLPKNLKNLYIAWNQSWSKEQQIILGTKIELENVLDRIKFLQRYQDFKYILNEIKYNPRLERMKTELEEEEKQLKEDPETFYNLIN